MKKFFPYILWVMLIAYTLVVMKLILFKGSLANIKYHFLHDYNWAKIKLNFTHANFIPLFTIKLYLNTRLRAEYSFENLIGNIVLFIPLGILLPLLFKGTRSLWKILIISFLVSLAFEVIQLITVLGSFDVDDILLNTSGGVIGYLFLKIFETKD